MNPGIIRFDGLQVIFVHVPKTAGFSVVEALQKADCRRSGSTGHTQLQVVHKSLREAFPGYQRIAVVRNPWDRLVSAFYYLQQGGRYRRDMLRYRALWPLHRGSFERFVDNMRVPSVASFWCLRDLALSPQIRFTSLFFLPQSFWLCDDTGVLLVDRVLRFESLQVAVDSFLRERGVKEISLQKRNVSNHHHYRECYSTEMRDVVGKVFADDIQRFGYQF